MGVLRQARAVKNSPVLHEDEHGALYLFCSRSCLLLYYMGAPQGAPRPGTRWGCFLCSRGIEEDNNEVS